MIKYHTKAGCHPNSLFRGRRLLYQIASKPFDPFVVRKLATGYYTGTLKNAQLMTSLSNRSAVADPIKEAATSIMPPISPVSLPENKPLFAEWWPITRESMTWKAAPPLPWIIGLPDK
jgi:hypothetical protein